MSKRKREYTIYRVIDDTHTGVYRFECRGSQRIREFIKTARDKEEEVPKEDYYQRHAYDAYAYGIPITKEQYDRYDPELGVIACGLIENHKNNIHYKDEYFAEERAKGIKRGY